MEGGKFGNNELIKETFVFEIFWEILYLHSESKTYSDECLLQPVSICMCLDQYKYINQIKQEGLFCEKCMHFFTNKTKTENRSYGVFRDSLLT